MTRLVLVAGATETAAIEGISAAGASPALRRRTPSADAEILVYGAPIAGGPVPRSPSGCVTPAAITRAARDLVGFDVTVVDAGLAEPTAAPTVSMEAEPGGPITAPRPVPNAAGLFERGRTFGRALPDEHLLLGETIPGGTTTALGVLRALGEAAGVSSSLATNPIALKAEAVTEGLAASGLDRGGSAGEPLEAVASMGDPVLATVAGIAAGALSAGRTVRLAGGTQLLAAAAILRHADITGPLALSTTTFVARDPTIDLAAACEAQDLQLVVTDPGFDRSEHPAMARYEAGEAKEGVGMGGALATVERQGTAFDRLRRQIERVVDRLEGAKQPAFDPAGR